MNSRDLVWNYGSEVYNKVDPVGNIRPRAKLRRGTMTKQPNKMLGCYIWDPRNTRHVNYVEASA